MSNADKRGPQRSGFGNDRRRNVNVGMDRQNMYDGRRNGDKSNKFVEIKKSYKKECTVCVHEIPHFTFKAGRVIEAAETICGENTVLAVVPCENNTFEITTDTEENALKLTNGIEIGGRKFNVTFQFSEIIVVSFLELPAYIEDKDIISKLESKQCEIKSDVYRHVHSNTQVADGTRYVRVKFPPGLVSLPWSVKFDTGRGPRFFRVKHNNQHQLCNMCGDPFHKYRACPRLICAGCDEQGHKLKECTAPKCDRCGLLPLRCFCPPIDDGTCTYCKSNPCKCFCENCHKNYNDCQCGIIEHDERGIEDDDRLSVNDYNESLEEESMDETQLKDDGIDHGGDDDAELSIGRPNSEYDGSESGVKSDGKISEVSKETSGDRDSRSTGGSGVSEGETGSGGSGNGDEKSNTDGDDNGKTMKDKGKNSITIDTVQNVSNVSSNSVIVQSDVHKDSEGRDQCNIVKEVRHQSEIGVKCRETCDEMEIETISCGEDTGDDLSDKIDITSVAEEFDISGDTSIAGSLITQGGQTKLLRRRIKLVKKPSAKCIIKSKQRKVNLLSESQNVNNGSQ